MKVIHQTIQTKLLHTLPLTALLVLTILYIVVYVSHTTTNTHAEAEVLSDNKQVTITASPERNLSVAVSAANISLDLTPTAEGVFKASDTPLTVTVSTNNPTGYNLNMATTSTDLTRTTPLSGQDPVINTLGGSGSFTSETFEDNAWGFSLDATNYYAVSASRQINQTVKESNSSTTDITFGVKLNNEIPSGDYVATLTFIATTNPLDATFDTAFDAAGKTQVSYNGNNYYKMQDMSGFICNMVATQTDITDASTMTTTTLIDIRDNELYEVGKMADGRCWLLENLRLGGDEEIALTSADTNIIDNFTMPISTTAISSSDSASYTSPKQNADYKNETEDNGYKYGNYYNVCTISAGTSCNPRDTNTKDIEYDICPSGWRMPTGGTNSEQYLLTVAYNNYNYFVNAYRPPYSGWINNSINNYTTNGQKSSYYRSSTRMNALRPYGIAIRPGIEDVQPFYGDFGYAEGSSIRCIARTDQTIEDAVYLQDVTPEMRQNTTEGTVATLYDKRDGQDYTVRKINGEIWMTQNLRFTGTTLTPADSNVATDTTMTYHDFTEATCYGETGYNVACIKTDPTYGAWYNYIAATAQTITSTNGLENAVYDICPTNWSLPSLAQQQEIINYQDNYNVIDGGIWYEGANSATYSGLWWSSTAGPNNYNRNFLIYNRSDNGILLTRDDGNLRAGYYVRCILK